MKTITVNTHREATAELLHLLGHEFSGSMQAQLDACQIDHDGDTYTHPSLPNLQVEVQDAD